MPSARPQKRSAEEAVDGAGERVDAVATGSGGAAGAANNGHPTPPAKRARTSLVASEPAPAPPTDAPPSPPPPPTDDAPPPPPPPLSQAEIAELVPPPPPPPDETSEARKREVEREQEQDDEAIGGAEYWSRITREEQTGKATQSAASIAARRKDDRDLYLDTIDRSVLDFDFEKLCSVSLSNINVYACLVCGKYFQGRGPSTYAYLHSINDGHRVFMNMESAQFYVLPDNYKVSDPSLADIQYLLQPTYSELQIKRLDAPDARDALDLRATPYLPGFVGLNNLGANDYMNVVVQALAHVRPLRNFFLRGGPPPLPASKGGPALRAQDTGKTIAESEVLSKSSELVRRFASLMRKIWNARNFKAQVSPHEFLQEVASASKGRFSITKQGDAMEFLGWLLNRLHLDLGGGGKRNKRSIISDCFMGHVRIESQKVFVRSGIELEDDEIDGGAASDKLDGDGRKESGQEDALGNAKFNIARQVNVERTSFFQLTVDLPPIPVFQDVVEKNIIPQVPMAEVLAKYDGVTFQEARGLIRRFKVMKLPPFVILHYKRFTKNNFIEERNRTIVNYPVKGLSMADYVEDPSLAPMSTVYDLVANITLDATAGTVRENTVWRSQVHTCIDGKPIGTPAERQERLRQQRRAARREEMLRNNEIAEDDDAADEAEGPLTEEEKWFSVQDLLVESVDSQLLFLGETYVQIWARRA